MSNIIQSVKGTRDYYPEDMGIRSWLYATARKVSESFGYQEFEGPFLESIELYAAKSGDELVKEQSFVFPDRGGNLIALRPELTPTLSRMVAQRQRQLTYPVRWWSFGPFWRYERPQKGRSREFFQWNIDLFGIETPEADAELVAIAANFFREVGLTPDVVKIFVNSRQLLDNKLDSLGFTENQKPIISRWIDRRSKLSPQEWGETAKELGLNNSQITSILELLENKELWRESNELKRFFTAIEAFGCIDYVIYDPNIVRGLDYYTGIVFEAFETGSNVRRSILGGGRYDNLLKDVGGEPLPGVGFAMGDLVVTLILESQKLIPVNLGQSPADVIVTAFDQETLPASFSFATKLRENGINVIYTLEPIKLGKQIKYADKIGIKIAIILGPEELKSKTVAIKNLVSGEQVSVKEEEATDTIRHLLARIKPPC